MYKSQRNGAGSVNLSSINLGHQFLVVNLVQEAVNNSSDSSYSSFNILFCFNCCGFLVLVILVYNVCCV